jgi:hypothetical protein
LCYIALAFRGFDSPSPQAESAPDRNAQETQMSTTIPLTYRVDYEIGLDAKDLTQIQIQEISAQQSIFYCRCLFYLLRQAAISEPHDPLFDPLIFLHALEEVTLIGEALSDAAYNHVENLAELKQKTTRRNKRKVVPMKSVT